MASYGSMLTRRFLNLFAGRLAAWNFDCGALMLDKRLYSISISVSGVVESMSVMLRRRVEERVVEAGWRRR